MIREIYLAGGCFWGLQKYLSLIPGVTATQCGYANGKTQNPTYREVCHSGTGHAETVKVEYNDNEVALYQVLQKFFMAIDPTTVNRQGNDVGEQYRTGIYYTNQFDVQVIEGELAQLQSRIQKPLAVEVAPLRQFYKAEEYHQRYLDKNPGGYCHIGPKLMEVAKEAPQVAYTVKSREQLRHELTDMQYHVTQERGTEPPFQNTYWNEYRKGIYVDITTGEPLFLSSDKFESSCGWPSFAKPIAKDLITEHRDKSHFMVRTEVRSKMGDAHLGHVFDDGPKNLGGLRYCINSAALRFIPKEDMRREGYGEFLSLVE